MLRLRPYRNNDAKYIVNWIGDERAFHQWCADRYDHYPLSADDINQYYQGFAEQDNFYEMTAFDETGIVGHLIMRFVDEEKKELRFGFVIVDAAKRGMGFGKEMLMLAIRYAFDILRAEKVTLGVFEENEAAYYCYKSLGFQRSSAEEETYEILGEVWKCRMLELQKPSEKKSRYESDEFAKHDYMTGMYNQQGFLEQLEYWKDCCVDTGEKIMLVCVDINRLGNINDIYGHSEGDVAIQTLAKILEDSLSENEICAHLGSDEFVAAVHVAGEEKRIYDSLVHAITGRIETYNRISDKEYSLDVNYSYHVISPEPGISMQASLDEAFAKKRIDKNNRRGYLSLSGTGPVENYNQEEENLVNRILDDNRFQYAYQPIVDAKTGEIYAYEALMRANIDDIPVSPFILLKYATKCHRLYDIERATFFNIFEEVSKKADYFREKKIFVNSIPSYQLDEADYTWLHRKYEDIIRQFVVEITEQTELNDAALNTLLERSKQGGFGIAIDDYGTGYSNTSSLLRYLPNCVKIDRLLISDIQEEPKKQHFVKSIIEFAHDNGFLALAEGVETAVELRAVIHMGVDLIQGFYTARPSLNIIQEIDEEIKKEIVSINIDTMGQINRKIYTVNTEKELPIMRLALEQYTGLLLSQNDLTLIGNAEYIAGLSIKIKDDSKCRLTLKNVRLESLQNQPCIDIGENAQLTLVLEGDNELNQTGIRVPEGSSLVIEGSGNLLVRAKGIQCYGIGNSLNAGVGAITYSSSGSLTINIEGNQCIGIGGGVYRQGDGVKITAGNLLIECASEKIIGIGCLEGSMPIDISGCRLKIDMNIAVGIGIGCKSNDQSIWIASSKIVITGSGSNLCGIGSTEKTDGVIHIASSKVIIKINGQQVRLLGNDGGNLMIIAENSGIELRSEGSIVSGVGSFMKTAVIQGRETSFEINIHAGINILLGAMDENISIEGGVQIYKINED